jgi:microcystin-dependent protein
VADANQVMANFYQIQNDVNTNAAHNGANSDITSLSGLTTPIPITEGGTGAATAAQALINLGVTAALAGLVAVPIGGSIEWNSTTQLPPGNNFAFENGQALSRTTYATLFSLIGTTWGAGDGSTTFNIPNTNGVFSRGWDFSGTIDPGRTLGVVQADAFQTHGHNVSDPSHYHTPQTGYNNFIGLGAGNSAASTTGTLGAAAHTGAATTGITVTTPNSGNPQNETRPKNIARPKIIRII